MKFISPKNRLTNKNMIHMSYIETTLSLVFGVNIEVNMVQFWLEWGKRMMGGNYSSSIPLEGKMVIF